MRRRRYLAVITTAAVAGCPSQSGEGATETATATQGATETPVATPTSTTTRTATETASATPRETDTPEPTPTAFDVAAEDAEAALREMHAAYVGQVAGAEQLTDVDARADSFDSRDVWDAANDVDDATHRAREAARSDAQSRTVDDLQDVRRYLYEAARVERTLVDKHDALEEIAVATDDEDSAAVESAHQAAEINDLPPSIRSQLQTLRGIGTPSAADNVAVMTGDEWMAKTRQFETAVSTLETAGSAVSPLVSAINALTGARDAELRGESDRAAELADRAATRLDRVADDLDALLDGDAAPGFVGVLQDMEEVVLEKLDDAESI